VSRRTRIALACGATVLAVAALVQLTPLTDGTVDVQLLAINDFHGALEPASGGTGRIGDVDAGGIEYLASHLARLRTENPNTVIVSAGDNIGGTPLLSGLFHDEPTVEALNLAGVELSALGNHDLDEGWWELYRMQRGGCHPDDGCQDGTPYTGAAFTYLAANVMLDPRQADPATLARAGIQGVDPRPLLPPYVVREIDGVRVGFIGVILQEAPSVITPAAIRGLTFLPEVDAANAAARTLRAEGVRAIVVLLHEGVIPEGPDINGCAGPSSDLDTFLQGLSADIDVVVSGHTHVAYSCTIDGTLLTSAAANGRLVTDIDLRIRRSDGEVMAKSARNLIVTQDIAKDPAQSALIARYRPLAEKVGARVIGSITGSLTREETTAGEMPLGRALADAYRDAAQGTPSGDADLAFMNPGGIRADLGAATSARPAPVTYAELFAVLPFSNEVVVKSVTGAALLDALEQQFGEERTRIMQVSKGFTYAYDPTRPPGQRIDRSSVRLEGAPLDPARQYRLVTNSFIWSGGDGLVALRTATDAVTIGVDVDVVADHFSRHSPIRPDPQDRIRRAR
jgi:5'-nucleotidase